MYDQVAEEVMQSGATATGNGTTFDFGEFGYNDLVLQVDGITTATITVEASNDEGTNWHAVQGTALADGTAAATVTADGLYRYNVGGLQRVRARISTYVSGTIDVIGRAQA